MSSIKLSDKQQAVINWALDQKGSLNLVARAGCGKTFTLMALVKAIVAANKGEVFLGAYNKAIATELQEKLKKEGIDWKKASAGTMHSAGYSAWKRVAKDVQINGKKIENLVVALRDECETKALQSETIQLATKLRAKASACELYKNFVCKAVSLAKQSAFGLITPMDDRRAWEDMVDHFGLADDLADEGVEETSALSEAISLCICILKRSIAQDREVIDFDDMILAPLVHKAKIWPKDWVLIDEAQDTNAARRALALAMLKPVTGRLVAVGDPAQAIYGFTGADSDAMELLRRQLGSQILPLNETYRCPKAVVKFANQWVPDLIALPEAPDGLHRFVSTNFEPGLFPPHFTDLWAEGLTIGDAVLCRNTKPLVEFAYTLLRKGIPCFVEGKEIGQGLVKLAKRWKVKTLPALVKKLESYQAAETTKWLAKGREEMVAAVEDKVATLRVLIDKQTEEGHNKVESLYDFINALFGDTKDGEKPRGVLLSTVHKSKGREWDRVYILNRELYMPSKWARKPWQIEQENNLLYVAATRAKRELIDIV
jgi:superfamily I DNA/RNA helicase